MILLMWEGRVESGEDWGQPETKTTIIENLDDIGEWVKKKNFKAFNCQEILAESILKAIDQQKNREATEKHKLLQLRHSAYGKLTKEEIKALGL